MRRVARNASAVMMAIVAGSMVAALPVTATGEPSPTGLATASPTEPTTDPSAPASTPPPLRYEDQPGEGTELQPGRYVTTPVPSLVVTFTVPEGWYKGAVDFAVFEIDSNSSVGFQSPDNVLADPCDPALGMRDPAIGPTVDDLVTALGAMHGLTTSEPLDVMVGGHAGKRVDITTDPTAGCTELALWDLAGIWVPGAAPGSSDQLWILDVDGTRLVIPATVRAGSPADVQAELQGIIESVQIEASASASTAAP